MANKPSPSNLPEEVQDTTLSVYPGSVPSTPILWPAVNHRGNQIQQTKGSAKPQAFGVQPTTQPNQSTVAPRTTPAHVSNVRVVSRNVGGQKNITVQFNHPSGDPYFSGAKVYLRSGTKEPVLVASGSKSPLTFTATNDSAPHSIHVTSVGNWGETDVLTSPAAPVKLFGPLNVSKQPSVSVGTGGGSPTPPPSGVTDGLIHGQGGGGVDSGSWEADPAYVVMRDDFFSAGQTGGAISTNAPLKVGDLGWTAIALTNGNALSSTLGTPPNLGTFSWENNGTASAVVGLVLTAGSTFNSGSFFNDNCMALLEYPNWKATFIWKTDYAVESTTTHNTAKKAMYIGFVGGTYAGNLTGNNSSRPNCFMGIRFDTSNSPGAVVVTAVGNGTGVYTVTSNSYVAGLIGSTVTFANCGSAANNGTFIVTAATATSLTTTNTSSVTGTGLTGSATYPTPPNDTYYTLEFVNNPAIAGGTYGRNNQSGTTYVTNVAPLPGVWHRLDLECTSVGVVTMTLDGSATNTLTVTIPQQVITGTDASANTVGGLSTYTNVNNNPLALPAHNFGNGTLVTVTGGLGTNYNITNLPITRVNGSTQFFVVTPSGSGLVQNKSAVFTGYPAWMPCFWMGNDDTASPTVYTITYAVDFFSLTWNPGVGGGIGTPVITNSRYFPSTVD